MGRDRYLKKSLRTRKYKIAQRIANPDDLFKHKNALIFRDDIPERTDIEAIKLIGKAKKRSKKRSTVNSMGIVQAVDNISILCIWT